MAANVFIGEKLRKALQFRGMRMAELARRTGISRQSLSLYANDENQPSAKNIITISTELGFPANFFMTEDGNKTSTQNIYFRSQASARKMDQNAEKIKVDYTARMYEVLQDYIDFPGLSLPDTMNFRNHITEPENMEADQVRDDIEKLAADVRKEWALGNGPIENLQYLLASHGIIVVGFNDVDNKIDAFTQKVFLKGRGAVYIIALATGFKPMTRLRFDMAHELGHILMHNWDDDNESLEKTQFNNLERQANMFASAFLLPADSFRQDILPYANKLEYYRFLKGKWKVSMQAMMYRAREIGVISGSQFVYLMRKVSANHERKNEKGDKPGTLDATVFQEAIDLLIRGHYITVEKLVNEFRTRGIYLNTKDMEDLMGLRAGTLSMSPQTLKFRPKLKQLDFND